MANIGINLFRAAEEVGFPLIGITADEVFGTFTTSEPVVLADAPREIPHCCGMLRHEGRLALALDLKRLVEAFPVPVI